MEHHYAVTVAEALRAILGGVLLGAVVFTIIFIILTRKYERP